MSPTRAVAKILEIRPKVQSTAVYIFDLWPKITIILQLFMYLFNY